MIDSGATRGGKKRENAASAFDKEQSKWKGGAGVWQEVKKTNLASDVQDEVPRTGPQSKARKGDRESAFLSF